MLSNLVVEIPYPNKMLHTTKRFSEHWKLRITIQLQFHGSVPDRLAPVSQVSGVFSPKEYHYWLLILNNHWFSLFLYILGGGVRRGKEKDAYDMVLWNLRTKANIHLSIILGQVFQICNLSRWQKGQGKLVSHLGWQVEHTREKYGRK